MGKRQKSSEYGSLNLAKLGAEGSNPFARSHSRGSAISPNAEAGVRC